MAPGTLLVGHVLMRMVAGPGAETSARAEAPSTAGSDEAPGEGPAGAEAVEAATPEAPLDGDVTEAPATDRPLVDSGRPAKRYHDTLLYTNYLGLGGGARFGRREIAVGPDTTASEATATGLASVQGRLAGFTSGTPRVGKGRRILTPELLVSVEFGATRRTAEGGAVARPGGVTLGAHGVLRLGLGRSMSRPVAPYVKGQLESRFAAFVHDTAEGNFLLMSLRGSAGIVGRSKQQGLVIMAGPALDGVAGAQRIGRRNSVVQLMAGGEVGIYAHPTPRLSLAWVGDARATIAGERYGGRRVEGRATFDVMLGLPLTQARPRYLSLFATYWGSDVRAAVGTAPVIADERRRGHAVLAGFGVGI
jgi:hypothetical protein